MESEQAFFDGVIDGVSISAVLAFVILLIATRNILVSIYALTSVVFIVLCRIREESVLIFEAFAVSHIATLLATKFF